MLRMIIYGLFIHLNQSSIECWSNPFPSVETWNQQQVEHNRITNNSWGTRGMEYGEAGKAQR